MLYFLQNKHLQITVNDLGAELWSVVHRGAQYLWQGDPTYWSGRAYNLFPICGRLTEGIYTWKGKTYSMDLHGFARTAKFVCIAQTDCSLTFRLEASAETRKIYPFDFCLDLTYTLSGRTLCVTFHVANRSGGEMPFAIGGHPGFNLPLGSDGRFEDWKLVFANSQAQVRRIVLSNTGYLTHKESIPVAAMPDGRTLPLRHSLFDHDGIFLENVCREVTLCADQSDRSVTLCYPDMPYLGIWHASRTEAPYICIEPWSSLPAYDGEIDDFATKRDMIRLAAGGDFQSSYTLTIT